jgi:tRNA pseudouridine38-40 synthase
MGTPYFLRLAYVGTSFHGWQIQTSLPSVQRELWKALQAVDPGAPMPQGTGRTDAGVHALAQGVLIHASRIWEPYRLLKALNAHLPFTVRVLQAEPAPEGFFPRQHAVAKRYVYRVSEGPAENPFEHGRRWHLRGSRRLDREAMAEAAAGLLGRHDFSSFRCAECAAESPVRTLHRVDLQGAGALLDLVFEGDRFLMHQVRIMAGTLLEVGRGRLPASGLEGILQARDRSRAGPTAPAEGLWLEQVWYQAKWGIGEPSPWPEGNQA